jgi:hypothetical protein
MSAWVKRLAIRFLAWLIGDDLAKTRNVQVLTAERDAAIQAPSTRREVVHRLEEGKF